MRHSRSLFLCGVAHVVRDGEAAARPFFARAAELEGVGHDPVLDPPRLRPALLRGDRETVARLVDAPIQRLLVWGPSVAAVRLDAHAILREVAWVEQTAPGLTQAGTYLEPFALRALGIVRGDDKLLSRAGELFAALGLGWHAAQTEVLAAG